MAETKTPTTIGEIESAEGLLMYVRSLLPDELPASPCSNYSRAKKKGQGMPLYYLNEVIGSSELCREVYNTFLGSPNYTGQHLWYHSDHGEMFRRYYKEFLPFSRAITEIRSDRRQKYKVDPSKGALTMEMQEQMKDLNQKLGNIQTTVGETNKKVDSLNNDVVDISEQVNGLDRLGSSQSVEKGNRKSNGYQHLLNVHKKKGDNELLSFISDTQDTLEEITVEKTSLVCLNEHIRKFFPKKSKANYCLFSEDNGLVTGCIFSGPKNSFVGGNFENSHNFGLICRLAEWTDINHFTTVRFGCTTFNSENVAEVLIGVDEGNKFYMSEFMNMMCSVPFAAAEDALINRIDFVGPRIEPKEVLQMRAEKLQELCSSQSVSCIQFERFHLSSRQLSAMRKGSDWSTYVLDDCTFQVENENSLLRRSDRFEKYTNMKLEVCQIPYPDFLSDCEFAIRRGHLTGLLLKSDIHPTRLTIAQFRSVVNIYRLVMEKKLGEVTFNGCKTTAFDLGKLDVEDIEIPSTKVPEAVRAAAEIHLDYFTDSSNEDAYNQSIIEAAVKVAENAN